MSKKDSVRLFPKSINHYFTLWSLFVLNKQYLNWLTGAFYNKVYLHHQTLKEVRFALALWIPVPMFSFDWLQLWMWLLLVPAPVTKRIYYHSKTTKDLLGGMLFIWYDVSIWDVKDKEQINLIVIFLNCVVKMIYLREHPYFKYWNSRKYNQSSRSMGDLWSFHCIRLIIDFSSLMRFCFEFFFQWLNNGRNTYLT